MSRPTLQCFINFATFYINNVFITHEFLMTDFASAFPAGKQALPGSGSLNEAVRAGAVWGVAGALNQKNEVTTTT